MTEAEIESLLGAYALDAVDDGERAEIEAHLATCPRCRAEVAAHREVTALLANSGVSAPDGLWDRIAHGLSPELPASAPGPAELLAQLPKRDRSMRRPSRPFAIGMLAVAAVALVIALLSLQVVNLNGEVHSNGGSGGVAAGLNSVLSRQHRTITLTSADRNLNATVAVADDGDAYWVGSSLKALPKSETYQLWTIVRGSVVVSLGVIGPNPKVATAFRLAANASRLMVTIEPEGGTVAPTSSAVVAADV
jgi:anti-sigma-K factor RskA